MITLVMITALISSQTWAGLKDDNLSPKEQSIAAIAALTAVGDLPALAQALNAGLDGGLSINEIKEVIVQMYAYAGFPRSLNALNKLMDVLKARKSRGIIDQSGKEASKIKTTKSKLDYGTDNQTRLVGSPVKGDVYAFAPIIDQFLKEHLFGDIFGRDILDYKTREIATIAALASLEGTSNQLRSHFMVGMHNGLTAEDLNKIVSIVKTKVGEMEGNNAEVVLKTIIKPNDGGDLSNEANSNFIGAVYVKMIINRDSIFDTQMASVTFEPKARTNWHYHPSGQILLITNGTAYYQEKGKPKETILTGQSVKCPPNVNHWHGATPESSMTHITVSPNLEMGSVVWLQKVTDEEYEK